MGKVRAIRTTAERLPRLAGSAGSVWGRVPPSYHDFARSVARVIMEHAISRLDTVSCADRMITGYVISQRRGDKKSQPSPYISPGPSLMHPKGAIHHRASPDLNCRDCHHVPLRSLLRQDVLSKLKGQTDHDMTHPHLPVT